MSKRIIVPSVTTASLEEQIEALKAEKAELLKAQRSEIRFKVSQKGAVSVYGMGRFPVTLYKEQWIKLLAEKDNVLNFIDDNEADLKTK